jgi:transposase
MTLQDTIGIDVSKSLLDAFCLSTGTYRQFANDGSGCSKLLRWIGRTRVRVVFEPSGPYHRLLEQRLTRAGVAMVKVNPRYARRFAEATGRLAKTDRIDASLLARMGAALDLQPHPGSSEVDQDLRELSLARRALIKDRTAARNREQVAQNALIRRQLKARLSQIEKQIGEIEGAMAAIVAADEALARRREILASIPGIGAVTAMVILVEMPELGHLEGKQAASLAGLAPMTRESGGWKGRSRIQGGRASLRCGLYMPALVAVRLNPDLRRKYEALKEAGKPSKVAIAAVMRKLIVLANALVRDNRTWSTKAA